MATAENGNKERSWPAIVGWGGLFGFAAVFAWLIISQIQSAEKWDGRKDEAVNLVKNSRPGGANTDTMHDLIRGYSLKAKEQGAYVGEFTWDAKQKDGPDYEVTLLWKEGEDHRVAVWRVDLSNGDIRPQGDEASGLPKRAQSGTVGR
jgi:hypothetical protein